MTTTNISFAPVLPAYNAAYDRKMIMFCPELVDQMLQAAMANFQNARNRMVGIRITMRASNGSLKTCPALFFGYHDYNVGDTHWLTAYFLVKIGSQYAIVASTPVDLGNEDMVAFTYQNRDTGDWRECFDVANRITTKILDCVVQENYRIVDATEVEECVRSALTFINEI